MENNLKERDENVKKIMGDMNLPKKHARYLSYIAVEKITFSPNCLLEGRTEFCHYEITISLPKTLY